MRKGVCVWGGVRVCVCASIFKYIHECTVQKFYLGACLDSTMHQAAILLKVISSENHIFLNFNQLCIIDVSNQTTFQKGVDILNHFIGQILLRFSGMYKISKKEFRFFVLF